MFCCQQTRRRGCTLKGRTRAAYSTTSQPPPDPLYCTSSTGPSASVFCCQQTRRRGCTLKGRTRAAYSITSQPPPDPLYCISSAGPSASLAVTVCLCWVCERQSGWWRDQTPSEAQPHACHFEAERREMKTILTENVTLVYTVTCGVTECLLSSQIMVERGLSFLDAISLLG